MTEENTGGKNKDYITFNLTEVTSLNRINWRNGCRHKRKASLYQLNKNQINRSYTFCLNPTDWKLASWCTFHGACNGSTLIMFEELEYWTQASRLKFEPAMSDIQLERVPTNLFWLNSQHKGEPQIWLPDKHKKKYQAPRNFERWRKTNLLTRLDLVRSTFNPNTMWGELGRIWPKIFQGVGV